MNIEELNAVFVEYHQSFNELKGVRFGDFCSPSHWRDLAIVETLLEGNFAPNLDNQRFMNQTGWCIMIYLIYHLNIIYNCIMYRLVYESNW